MNRTSADEAVVMAMAPCAACGTIFWFNPVAVPSITPPGKEYRDREPICETCMTLVNDRRKANGLDALPVRPDAYEPLPAENLP